jgi:GxxExxY protein
MANEDMRELVEQVWRELGPGYTESIYHNALEVLLRQHHMQYETERIIPVTFQNHVVGNLRADLIVDGAVVELKSVRTLTEPNRDQIKTYMKLLHSDKGYLVNFGSQLQFEELNSRDIFPT